MLRRFLNFCRSHPVLTAAILGAAFGAANVVAIEIGGIIHKTPGGVFPLLWSSAASDRAQLNPVQTATILLIEFAGNVLAFALLFSVPVALVVVIRRLVRGGRKSAKNSDQVQADHSEHL